MLAAHLAVTRDQHGHRDAIQRAVRILHRLLIEALQHVSDAAADDWVNDTLSTERWVRHAFGHRSDTAARQAFPGRLLATLAEEADLAEAG